MKIRFLSLIALATVFAATTATAQTTPPVLLVSIVQVAVSDGSINGDFNIISGGLGYATSPQVTVTGGGGDGLNIIANVSGGSVTSLTINPNSTNYVPGTPTTFATGGENFIGNPTLTFAGGGTPAVPASGANFEAFLNYPTVFLEPYQNEVYGPAGRTISIAALASGTQPLAGFTYTFLVNGLSIGESQVASPGTPAGGPWTPPLPGVYVITTSTKDGNGNIATSAGVRYFATGTAIVSPEAGGTPPPNAGQGNPGPGAGPGTLLPIGSSIVISATSTPADGFVQRIDFYTDWAGAPNPANLLGSSYSYPYSVVYTPAGIAGTVHVVKALAYDNNGNLIPALASLDQVTLTMITPVAGALPTCVIITPSSGNPIEIPNYVSDPTASIPVIVTAGAGATGSITRVEFYVDGVLNSTDTAYPYNFTWTPAVTGTYTLTALAYDNHGNVIASTSSTAAAGTTVPTIVTIAAAPAVAIVAPGPGGTIGTGGASIKAVAIDTDLDASGNPATIVRVDFYQDGNFVKSATSPVTGDQYGISFLPVQKFVDGVVVPSVLTAIATDTQGFQGTSPGVSVSVTSGGASAGTIGTPPTASLVSPLNNANVIVNTPVILTATGTASNGNIAKVEFLVDSTVVGTLTQYPYAFTYKFQNLGHYYVQVQVTDNDGDVYITPAPGTNIIVVTEPPPTVNITSPSSGGTVTTGSSVTVTANASSLSGTISQVEFFENGISIGVATMPPYTETFTPLSAGLYTFTAVATDGAGETTTTAPVIVEAFPSTGGLGTTSFFGQYQGLTAGGRFAFIVVDGTLGTFIGHSNAGTSASTTFASDIPVSPGGSFAAKAMTGNVSVTGVSGNLIPSQDLFIGAATQSGSVAVAAGYYTGNILGQAGSQVTAILGADGEFMAYLSSGSYTDVADGTVDSTGAFTITTTDNDVFTGKVDPSTGFLTGTVSGASGGSVIGARVSGGTFSDGVLENISTRGQVGSGANAMIAGFVVGGTTAKQLLVRAVGPTLSSFGLAGAVSATQLQIYSGATLISSNTGWSSTPSSTLAVSNADAQVGAFALPSGSADSAIVGSFPPGDYTAMVTGVGGATGIGLAEVYDMDMFTPFTTKKLTNVSTRGVVGTGNNVLIGGFVINGTAPKRLLIRGAGPALTALNVSGALATPHLQLFNGSQATIRENYSWQTGNDAGLVASAELATGAFAFGNGSADSAILIVLPPGTYTAEVSGVNAATGTALVEVYEVP